MDRAKPTLLWVQVLDDLRARLAAGEFDERFPTDVELMAEYEVSRHTVRDAVRRLEEEGLLDRRQGLGTFVRATRIEQPLGAIYSLFRSVEAEGVEQRSVVRTLDERRDAPAASRLGLRPTASLVYVERLRLAGDEPIALDWSWLPAALARPLLDADFSHTALYEELAARCGVAPTSGWERIRPVLPDPEQRKLLHISARQPLFAIERLTETRDRPLEWRHSLVRGDRFSFVARWSPEWAYLPALAVDPAVAGTP